jgi:peroxiredoxin
MLPHERSLVKKYEGKPFSVVGVNSDEPEELKKALKDNAVTWRSFRDQRANKPAISIQWSVEGWPTLYLIDHKGIIRRHWQGAPLTADLNREIDKLIEAALTEK